MAADIQINGHVLDGVVNRRRTLEEMGGPTIPAERFVNDSGVHNATQTTPYTPVDKPSLKFRHLDDVFAAITLHFEASC